MEYLGKRECEVERPKAKKQYAAAKRGSLLKATMTTKSSALHLKEVTSTSLSSEEIMRKKCRGIGYQKINIALSISTLLLNNNNIVSTRAQCNPCDSNPNGFVVVPSTGCTKYVSCQNGQATGNEQTCNGGLIFDPNIKGCNWDYMATCPPDPTGCDGNDTEDEESKAEVGSSSKKEKVECDLPLCAPGQTGTVVVPHTDCGQYVSCSNGVFRIARGPYRECENRGFRQSRR